MRIWLFSVLLLGNIHSFSQGNIEEKMATLLPVDTLPSGLLKGKTVVLLEMESESTDEWDKVTTIVHENLKKAGVDAVAYYLYREFFAGVEVSRSFALDLMKREIDHMVLVKYTGDQGTVAVLVPVYNEALIQAGTTAWIKKGPLNDIMKSLYIRAANSGLERTNFLINDVPERGVLTDPINGQRATYFSIVLDKNKLAIPKMNSEAENAELNQILSEVYPFAYGLVEGNIPEPELLSQGYQFILRHVKAPLLTTRDFLGYEHQEGVTAYMSSVRNGDEVEMKAIRIQEEVYKYYIKHIRSGTTYLGTEWDVDHTWQEALKNHINSMKNKTGIK
ncbi:MAG: hypothetical protein OEY51_10540 [Cyclobacteriaceae bacterium]|nr:hypothetical protein [Cyclobacteriaceae bacterium]